MLTNLKIINAYSIGELNLSFIKGKFTYKADMVYKDVVNPVAIYGENGSGKTSVVNVLNDFLNLLISDKEGFYPLIANFNNKKGESSIELTFVLEGKEYVYHLSTLFVDSLILNEYLLKDNKPIFTRNEERILIKDKEIEVNGGLLLSLRQLYSVSNELEEYGEDIKMVYNYLTNLTIIKDNSICNSKLCNYKKMEDIVVNNSDEIKKVISSWRDFPVYDFILEEENYYLNMYVDRNRSIKLPGFLISDGMLVINKILSILINLDRNSILIIDGIEKNLHPFTVIHLIKEAQKREIQLIFTSHNTSLMQELRPDQIYFAKMNKGNSCYFRLSNIYDNIRKINNIEKMYLSNTFNEAINQLIKIEE